jgi:hypothetical protein
MIRSTPSTAARLAMLLGVMCGCTDTPEVAAEAQTLSIEIDTIWSSNPANPDVRRVFGLIERGPYMLLDDAYTHGQVFLPVVDSLGNTIRKIGSPGDGSGEYTNIQMIAAHEDRVYVFDRWRIAILDTAFKLLRHIDIPFKVERGVVLANGLTVVTGDGLPDRHDFALHLFDDSGKLVRSFDPVDRAAPYSRTIAPGRANTVWSYERYSDVPAYTIKRWDPLTGQVVQTIEDKPDWFVTPVTDSSTVPAEGAFPNAPAPRVARMWESPDGVLWIGSAVGEARWRTVSADFLDRMVDGVLEARDGESGQLLATRRFDEYLTAFTEDGRVLMLSHGADDRPRYTLVRVTLKGR